MKKITKTVYEYSELSDKAKQRALEAWRERGDMPFLQSELNDLCGQLLKEQGIKCISNFPVCLYSLSHCQGDGLMFEGEFEWRGYEVSVKHVGHYYHSKSREISISDKDGNYAGDDIAYDFDGIYESICEELERIGYERIEEENSEERFLEECGENGWLFDAHGVMQTPE